MVSDLLIFVTGLALIFLAYTEVVVQLPSLSKGLEALGFSLAGYAPIRLFISARTVLGERRVAGSIDRMYRAAVRVVEDRSEMPIFIAVDVEGCITPPLRTEVDLRKFQRVRAYCEFVRDGSVKRYPSLVVFTGRPQGYVELLAQSLAMINPSLDLPFVIENGSALYYPAARRTVALLGADQRVLMHQTYEALVASLPEHEFEPKAFMITINADARWETIDDLRRRVFEILKEKALLDRLVVNTTASAVDVTPRGIDKLSGLRKVLEEYRRSLPEHRDKDLEEVVALADSTSDLPILRAVGRAYCPSRDVHPEVKEYVEQKFGRANVIESSHIDFVIEVLQREAGIRLL